MNNLYTNSANALNRSKLSELFIQGIYQEFLLRVRLITNARQSCPKKLKPEKETTMWSK